MEDLPPACGKGKRSGSTMEGQWKANGNCSYMRLQHIMTANDVSRARVPTTWNTLTVPTLSTSPPTVLTQAYIMPRL